jgi:ParB family transcriptional regulator, chromosome partitioning protein
MRDGIMTNNNATSLYELDQNTWNARTIYNAVSIAELAVSTRSKCILQSPIVREIDKKGHFFVTDGGSRSKLERLLAEAKKLDNKHLMNNLLRRNNQAPDVRLSQNFIPWAIHAANQSEDYSNLVDQSKSICDIALTFGTIETIVCKKLAVGRILSVLSSQYRDDEMCTDQLVACMINDHADHAWLEYAHAHYNQPVTNVRDVFGETMSTSDKQIGYIRNLDAYEAADGAGEFDLYNGVDDHTPDAVLLETMVADTLREIALKVKMEGWSWVEIMPNIDRDLIRSFDRHYPQPIDLTNGELAELDRLTDEYGKLSELIDDGVADYDSYAKAEVLQTLIDALNCATTAYTMETMELGGAIITFDCYGRVNIDRGFVKRPLV